MRAPNKELHRTGRIGWLRAAVLGANDGILSTSSSALGVAAATDSQRGNRRGRRAGIRSHVNGSG